ncbi:MAG: DNA-protecting protein DprA, partial [Bacteroidales bacterium]|nr:DNA-protecting protein DprA [Bacteroidales bacterium]
MGDISAKDKGIGIVGSRELPESFRGQVADVVRYLLDRGYRIHSGGAIGADLFALQSVIDYGAYSRAAIFSAWSGISGFPRIVQSYIQQYIHHGGCVHWGVVQPHSSRRMVIDGLLLRNSRLVRASCGLVAFLYGESRGTTGTILEAIKRDIKVVVFDCGGGSILPDISGGKWHRLNCAGCFCNAY